MVVVVFGVQAAGVMDDVDDVDDVDVVDVDATQQRVEPS